MMPSRSSYNGEGDAILNVVLYPRRSNCMVLVLVAQLVLSCIYLNPKPKLNLDTSYLVNFILTTRVVGAELPITITNSRL